MSGHLVLTRKAGEALCFHIQNADGSSTEFKLSIDRNTGKQIRLSIDAPNNVKVFREELL